jgi:hypothetical protein
MPVQGSRHYHGECFRCKSPRGKSTYAADTIFILFCTHLARTPSPSILVCSCIWIEQLFKAIEDVEVIIRSFYNLATFVLCMMKAKISRVILGIIVVAGKKLHLGGIPTCA